MTKDEIHKLEFLKLYDGENVFRIVSKPYLYQCHNDLRLADMPDYGMKYKCFPEFGECCGACKSNPFSYEISRRWLVGVIGGHDNRLSILDIDTNIFRHLQKIVQVLAAPEKFEMHLFSDYGRLQSIVPKEVDGNINFKNNFLKKVLEELTLPKSDIDEYKIDYKIKS